MVKRIERDGHVSYGARRVPDEPHRPARVDVIGTTVWMRAGQCHRDGGPAILGSLGEWAYYERWRRIRGNEPWGR
jgi:hypothetical protein